MFGRILISLTSMIFCFLRASLLRFCSSYLYLPKSMILQTGGSALGETSTRSSPTLVARSSASAVATTPTFSPVSSISRIVRSSMVSFTRGPPRDGVGSKGGLAMDSLHNSLPGRKA